MLRVLILINIVAVFAYAYGPRLLGPAPMLTKLKRIPVQTAVFAILLVAVAVGFRNAPATQEPASSPMQAIPEVEATSGIAPPDLPKDLSPQEAAASCVEQALSEARATADAVAENWLSSVEGFLDTGPGEITVQFAVGPRAGPPKGPQCRSEARLTCAVRGQDVTPVSPLHMTGAKIAC